MQRQEMISSGPDANLMTRLAVSYAQLWCRVWPFERGRGFPMVRLMSIATERGVMEPTWVEFKPGLWMKLDVRDFLQRKVLLSKDFDPDCTKFILGALKPGMVFLDIGAHAGYYALVAAQAVGSKGRVLCVEPNPAMVAQFRGNIERSGLSNVTIVEAACSDKCETRTLYVPDFPLSVKSSLASESAGTSNGVEVKCVTADLLCEQHALSRVDVMKIDVEGAEMQVLAGMVSILSNMRPKIAIELRPGLLKNFSATVDEAIGFLRQLGYRVSASDDDGNYFFVHQP
jgi:FkbM family methyltransferase